MWLATGTNTGCRTKAVHDRGTARFPPKFPYLSLCQPTVLIRVTQREESEAGSLPTIRNGEGLDHVYANQA
ncbi:hypothetical protein DPMN_100382 [Dreissena polymorpha]|uniref:Uncharacterized protein n=1 Tax=Dreissena polymorpha TaxID=45954 RepID=A0A9D4LFP7_DREPO|nr:hypothetical protein DPMN_100382 [Dreissena polymorpha]